MTPSLRKPGKYRLHVTMEPGSRYHQGNKHIDPFLFLRNKTQVSRPHCSDVKTYQQCTLEEGIPREEPVTDCFRATLGFHVLPVVSDIPGPLL